MRSTVPDPAVGAAGGPPTVEAVLAQFDELMHEVADRHIPEFLEIDITMAQAKVMHLAHLRPGISISAIAAELGVGLSSVSGLVDRLVEHGYLERREDPDDRRQHLVTVSPRGVEVMNRLRDMNAYHMRRLLERLESDELDLVGAAIGALVRSARSLDEASLPTSAHE